MPGGDWGLSNSTVSHFPSGDHWGKLCHPPAAREGPRLSALEGQQGEVACPVVIDNVGDVLPVRAPLKALHIGLAGR